jgi:hypothetical protein
MYPNGGAKSKDSIAVRDAAKEARKLTHSKPAGFGPVRHRSNWCNDGSFRSWVALIKIKKHNFFNK